MKKQADSILTKASHNQAVEIHINDETLETRHCFVDLTFRIHDGYTFDDVAAGWRQVMAFYIDQQTDDEVIKRIEKIKQETVARLQTYWNDLAGADDIERVIYDGEHYTLHHIVEGSTFDGFGGQVFRVEWLDSDREPTICTLFAQGPIPMWMRNKLPNNARSIERIGRPTRKEP